MKLTMDHAEGSDGWNKSGVMCACDHEILIGC